MAEAVFMGVVLSCLERTGHDPQFVHMVRVEFLRIEAERPDLAARYWQAFGNRDAGEMEKLLSACSRLMDDNEKPNIGNLRINAVTGKFHVGNGNRNVPLFSSAIPYH
jgi:hypothetical protein